LEGNVHNIAVEGNFDDCQNLVKASFADQSFLPEGRQLVAVNSINWARIMAQIVYYFYAGVALGAPHRKVSFSVPTGNFGDIFAGYLAKKMGLPIDKLIIATNSNDILHRCISKNDHSKQPLKHSLSPSMDIMVSSNFERLLFDLYDSDGGAISQLMKDFQSASMSLDDKVLSRAQSIFSSERVDDEGTVACIKEVFDTSAYMLDPHSAIGVKAARSQEDLDSPVVCLATAHPAKFPEAILKSGISAGPELPVHMQDLHTKEERYQVLPNQLEKIQAHIKNSL